jgi:hypothetical protein
VSRVRPIIITKVDVLIHQAKLILASALVVGRGPVQKLSMLKVFVYSMIQVETSSDKSKPGSGLHAKFPNNINLVFFSQETGPTSTIESHHVCPVLNKQISHEVLYAFFVK